MFTGSPDSRERETMRSPATDESRLTCVQDPNGTTREINDLDTRRARALLCCFQRRRRGEREKKRSVEIKGGKGASSRKFCVEGGIGKGSIVHRSQTGVKCDAHTSSSFTRLISRRDVRGCKICLGISLALNRFLGSKWRVVGGLISSRGLWFSVWLSIGCEVTTRNRWCNFRRSKLVSTYKMSVIFSSMHALMISFHFIEF